MSEVADPERLALSWFWGACHSPNFYEVHLN